MFNWIKQFIGTSAELIEAEFALAKSKLRQLGVLVVVAMIGVMLIAASIVGLLVGVVMILAPRLGAAEAVLAVSSMTLFILLVAVGITMAVTQPKVSDDVSPAEAAQEAKQRLHDMFDGSGDKGESGMPGRSNKTIPGAAKALKFVEQAIGEIAAKPQVLVGSVFAVVSILGVGRTFRMVRRAATVAAAGAMAVRTAAALKNRLDEYISAVEAGANSSGPAGVHSPDSPASSHSTPGEACEQRERSFTTNSAADHEDDLVFTRSSGRVRHDQKSAV